MKVELTTTLNIDFELGRKKYTLLEIMYNLDMEHDIYWSKQRRDLIAYITRIQVIYYMSCGTMPYTPCIVDEDIANIFRTITYDV